MLLILALYGVPFVLRRRRSHDNKSEACPCGEDCTSTAVCNASEAYAWPEYCGVPQLTPAEALMLAMRLGQDYGSLYDECFLYHELARHGSCSGYSDKSYLEAIKTTYDRVADTESFQLLENASGNSLERGPFLAGFGGAAAAASCDDNCALLQVFTCWDRTDTGRVADPRDCPFSVSRGSYTGSCAACDVIYIAPPWNASDPWTPNATRDEIDLVDGLTGLRPFPNRPTFDYFVLSLIWANNDRNHRATAPPYAQHHLVAHGLWPNIDRDTRTQLYETECSDYRAQPEPENESKLD